MSKDSNPNAIHIHSSSCPSTLTKYHQPRPISIVLAGPPPLSAASRMVGALRFKETRGPLVCPPPSPGAYSRPIMCHPRVISAPFSNVHVRFTDSELMQPSTAWALLPPSQFPAATSIAAACIPATLYLFMYYCAIIYRILDVRTPKLTARQKEAEEPHNKGPGRWPQSQHIGPWRLSVSRIENGRLVDGARRWRVGLRA